jgi:hypothetical protein
MSSYTIYLAVVDVVNRRLALASEAERNQLIEELIVAIAQVQVQEEREKMHDEMAQALARLTLQSTSPIPMAYLRKLVGADDDQREE